MKPKLLLRSVLFVTPMVLLSGCVGYNSTLFTTKSNVGLDIDTKPPTIEISVSRKEVAVAPTFEDGKTPPVMASFVSRSGLAGGFRNFFLGVSQTFAGGDAAVALSELYTNRTPSSLEITNYNSAHSLTRPPVANGTNHGWFWRHLFGLPEPGHVRPFIFATDTSLGLKVAWSGTGGQFPDTVRAGFSRKEFAFAPVFYTPNNDPTKSGGTNQMPSFLATIDSNIKGGAGADIANTSSEVGAIQYFATGQAATYLSLQQAVRSAMILRADPDGPMKAALLAAGAADVETINKKKTLAAAYKTPANRPALDAAIKQATGKNDFKELMRTGTPEEVNKAYDAARTANLTQ